MSTIKYKNTRYLWLFWSGIMVEILTAFLEAILLHVIQPFSNQARFSRIKTNTLFYNQLFSTSRYKKQRWYIFNILNVRFTSKVHWWPSSLEQIMKSENINILANYIATQNSIGKIQRQTTLSCLHGRMGYNEDWLFKLKSGHDIPKICDWLQHIV